MQYTFNINEIESIWAQENEKLDFIDKFKRHIHLSFKDESQLSRWEKMDEKIFLKALKVEGRLKSVSKYKHEIVIEII